MTCPVTPPYDGDERGRRRMAKADLLVLCAPGIHAVDLQSRTARPLCGYDGAMGSDQFVTCPECLWLLQFVNRSRER